MLQNRLLWTGVALSTLALTHLRFRRDCSGLGTRVSGFFANDDADGKDSEEWQNLTDADGTLFFTAYDARGHGLWRSTGTAGGTVLLKRLASGTTRSIFKPTMPCWPSSTTLPVGPSFKSTSVMVPPLSCSTTSTLTGATR